MTQADRESLQARKCPVVWAYLLDTYIFQAPEQIRRINLTIILGFY